MERILHRLPRRWLLVLPALGLLASWGGGLFSGKMVSAASTVGPSFVEFESGQVRPVAKSPDGNTLFAANTPNGTLEIFDLKSGLPTFEARVPVGLEPVAIAPRGNNEVWVVNNLSDSVSIV